MIPIQRSCDVENIGDFGRYYQQSWVGWHSTDSATIQPCFVVGLLDGANAALRFLNRGENNTFTLQDRFPATWSNIRDHIDFGVPDIGIMPDGPTILFCSYTSPRQARKGFRSRETRLADFNSWDIRKKYSRPPGDRYDWTWFAFNPEYKTLEQAEDILAKGEKVGVPLSRTLGVYTSPKYKNSLLAYKRWTIGHVVNPFLVQLRQQYSDYEEDIARQTGAEVVIG